MSEKEIKEKQKSCKTLSKEWYILSLRDMVNSVWCYNNYKDIEEYMNNRYILNYQENNISMEEIREIVINQVNYLNNNCEIIYNVGQDSDGITYNSIIDRNEV